jgi:alkylation response protein AidB-like acyl-CoA dehydrogenase
VHFGSDVQKRTWLPAIASGDCLPTIAVTEPDSGGYVLGMEATAERAGDEYVLNGRKIYIGNSHVGDLHGVVVRTGTGSRGLSAFLVESGRPGLSLAPHKQAMGLHGFSFGELVFDDCRVPAANMLGREGDGLAVAYSSSPISLRWPSASTGRWSRKPSLSSPPGCATASLWRSCRRSR